MRLAQIARKVGMTPTDIKRFLESEFELNIGKEPNYKLDETQVNAVLEKFPVIEEPEVAEVVERAVKVEEKEVIPEDIIDEAPIVSEIDQEENDEEENDEEEITIELVTVESATESVVAEEAEAIETIEEVIPESATRVEINYDDEGESINEAPSDFKEVEVNPDAEIIQAPKIKLDGLKVLGKIELPSDKIVVEEEKTAEEVEAEEADEIASLDAAMQSQVQDVKAAKIIVTESKATVENTDTDEELYSEYKDNKGFYHFSHTQKENRAKALVEIELKQKAIDAKDKKKRHYEELMREKKAKGSVGTKSTATPPKPKKIKKVKKQEVEAPKGIWAKFVHWLND